MMLRTNLALISLAIFLSGCQHLKNEQAPEVDELLNTANKPDFSLPEKTIDAEETESSTASRKKPAEFYPGSGVFTEQAQQSQQPTSKGDITLNFQETDIHEVIKVILGDLLKKNYVIDPAVSGKVNIETSSPLSKRALLPVLENLLQMNGAAMLENDGVTKITPLTSAAMESLPPRIGKNISSGQAGYWTQIVPLNYIAVNELQKILQPFLKDTVAQADPQRNLLILSGTQSNLKKLLETIQTFDVDWLRGMSLGIVPVNNVEAKIVIQELDQLFGKAANSPLAGVVRFIALDRLNSIIIITQQPRYLREMTQWIERLDRADNQAGKRLYVYHVQNGRAADLAAVLGNIFSGDSGKSSAILAAEVAPGLEGTTLNSAEASESDNQPAASNADPVPTAPTKSQNNSSGVTLPSGDAVKVIADEVNNSLVILASTSDYRMVEQALRQLDITPLQVLIEASIVEVSLTDDLEYGLQWFFKNGIGDLSGQGLLDGNNTANLNGVIPGFSYSLVDAADNIRGVFNALASESKINVLSSPSLMVLDNHTATINVGDQVPTLTSQSTSNIGTNSPTVNQIQYRDTGVLMTVTPRVNASGLIIMEVKQEVTNDTITESSGIESPTFRKRSIESTIAVDSGNTIVLGGLIRDNRDESKSGLPILHKAPIVGPLFGQTSNGIERTELVILITPRVIRNQLDTWEITEEFKQKLRQAEEGL